MSDPTLSSAGAVKSLIPNVPMVMWLVGLSVAMGFIGGLPADEIVRAFNNGFGRALGEFALILLPSFVLASAMSSHDVTSAKRITSGFSPIAGAGMICPDTAYAALSPVAGRNKLDVAFGSYAGFKLLFPAGPFLVATGLRVETDGLLLYGLALVFPVWLIGAIWVRVIGVVSFRPANATSSRSTLQDLRIFAPFGLLAILLGLGFLINAPAIPILDFVTQPKGALFLSAAYALSDIDRADRRDCLDTSVRRTGSLLLVIGAAAAFGALITELVPISDFFLTETGVLGVVSLFALTATFKLAQGSSMATFAAVTPVAAPIVASSDMSSFVAVFAVCLGSFIAILPNDSFYWLVRQDALDDTISETRAIWVLGFGSILQAIVGLILVLLASTLGWV